MLNNAQIGSLISISLLFHQGNTCVYRSYRHNTELSGARCRTRKKKLELTRASAWTICYAIHILQHLL